MTPGKFAAWFLACRPKTLAVSLSPVLLGSALAWRDSGQVLWLPLLVAALAAALIQIGTNLFNDVGDFLRGTDTPDRLGPRRASAEGWLTPQQVRVGAWLSFALAFACGIYLVRHGGWPIVAIGLASLAAGWAYTGGPRPIAYGPLGELFVFLFFGLLAVSGTYYLQTLNWSSQSLLAGALLGLHAAAVISVNNYRDLDGDARSGKRTLAVRIGRPAMRRLFAGQILLPYALLALLADDIPGSLLSCLSLPLALALIYRFTRQAPGPAFNRILARTAALQLCFAVLMAAGMLFVAR